ncbi:Gfo/Idh/MocA family protein [Nonomuraea sp. NPDC050790]|uniref:Gfo/Idh/MocA family protein n=1 Tax=Nonomuraea sp. NPDC050790 TaxID=3364371 RepID=UPI0037B94E5A
MNRPLRAAVIGLGWAGTVHANALTRIDGVNLVAVADPDPVRRAAYPHVHQAADVSELLPHGLDYCIVATPTATHEQIGLALADASIHALIEKPLAPSLAASRRLVDAFERRGLIAAVGHTERRNPAIAELATLLRTGEFGQVYAVATRRHSPFPDRVHDVGVVTDIGIHDLDLITYLTGRRITSITAHTMRVSGRGHDDAAMAMCMLEGGGMATVEVSRLAPLKERLIILHTAAGRVCVDAVTRTITHHLNAADGSDPGPGGFPGMAPGRIIIHQVEGLEPFHAQSLAFRDALQGRAHDLVTLREGAAAVAATEATLASAHSGITVTVPELFPKRSTPYAAAGSIAAHRGREFSVTLTVDVAVQFFPRGGSAQVIRYLASDLAGRGHRSRILCGSLGIEGEFSHAESFYTGLPVAAMDYNRAADAYARGGSSMDGQPSPFHPSYEDRGPQAPDRMFTAIAPATIAHLIDAWACHLAERRSKRPDLVHVHHLSHLQHAVARAYPGVPAITTLHGTDLKLLDQAQAHVRLADRIGVSLPQLALACRHADADARRDALAALLPPGLPVDLGERALAIEWRHWEPR